MQVYSALMTRGLLVIGLALGTAQVGWANENPVPERPTSIANAGIGAWTTPAKPGERTRVPAAYRRTTPPLSTTAVNTRREVQLVSSNSAIGSGQSHVYDEAYYRSLNGGRLFDSPPPPPPPPPGGFGLDTIETAPPSATAPAPRYVQPTAPYYTVQQPGAAPAAPVAGRTSTGLPPPGQRQWSCCGLPCEDGISMWRFGVVGGYVSYSGEDAGNACDYWGFDFGRQFCGCWGLDLFYRWHSGTFDRLEPDGSTFEDGAEFSDGWHHIGIKFTYGRSFNGSRLYWFVGAGPEYWWTEGYIDDDSGFGIYGELGLGYRISRNFSVQLALMIHGVDTEVTRKDPDDDGDSRWLWMFAPTLGVNVHF